MNASLPMLPKHWLMRALLVLLSAGCSVPDFEVATDAGTAASHCSNRVSDEGETGLDCGGTCPACGPGGTCAVDADCANNGCLSGVCQDASCTDGVLSGLETDQDCGGGACVPCLPGLHCVLGRDCTSQVCGGGTCAAPTCADMTLNGDESDLDCGGSCAACQPGQHCKRASDCAGGSCDSGTCSLSCLEGKDNCDGIISNGCETNLKSDPQNCGACGVACTLAQASASCSGGSCEIEQCTAPFADCDGKPENGCETNTSTDGANCGGCNQPCLDVHGKSYCAESKCQITCDAAYQDCDQNDLANGCETPTGTDATNCGACKNVCPGGPGLSAYCKDGTCGTTVCPTGKGDCNGDPAKDGCEVDLQTSLGNCGACGHPCTITNGTPVCTTGMCKVLSCNPGYADCNSDPTDGCETNTSTNTANCGACKNACAINNATAQCVGGACKVGSCTPPFRDCDSNPADCETDTSSNTGNCGACQKLGGSDCNAVYAGYNATGKCVAKACQLDKCLANFADCDGVTDTNGCEADLRTSNANCGACKSACLAPHGSNTCAAGVCVPSCDATSGDCDGNVKTGCEAVLTTDANNCGSCGTVCAQTNASNTCSGGQCNPTCSQSYFKTCDGNDNNGCEVDDRTSKANCGGCGIACQDNQTSSNECSGSSCAPVCLSNHANCDGNPNNGCETPTATDSLNCGGCGVQCETQNAASTTCGNGNCAPTCNAGFAACSNPAAGCLTSLDSAAHCGSCANACSGGTPFCVSRACAAHLDISVVDSNTKGTASGMGQSLTVVHTLQTSAAANPYRLVVVGISGYGNGSGSLPKSVQYNLVDMTLAKVITPTNSVSASIYYLTSASLPAAAGAYNLVVASSGSNGFNLTANVLEFINVEQAKGPIDAVAGQANNNQCSSHPPSDAVSVSMIGDFIYSVAGVTGTANDTNPNSTGQTITEQTTITNIGTVAGYLKAVATGQRTITWALGSCMSSAHALISIKPALTP